MTREGEEKTGFVVTVTNHIYFPGEILYTYLRDEAGG